MSRAIIDSTDTNFGGYYCIHWHQYRGPLLSPLTYCINSHHCRELLLLTLMLGLFYVNFYSVSQSTLEHKAGLTFLDIEVLYSILILNGLPNLTQMEHGLSKLPRSVACAVVFIIGVKKKKNRQKRYYVGWRVPIDEILPLLFIKTPTDSKEIKGSPKCKNCSQNKR